MLLLIVSPLTWVHHLILLDLPAIVLAALSRRRALAAAGLVGAGDGGDAILAHDSGRLVIAVKNFVPWANMRLLMLLVLYAVFLHIDLIGQRRESSRPAQVGPRARQPPRARLPEPPERPADALEATS